MHDICEQIRSHAAAHLLSISFFFLRQLLVPSSTEVPIEPRPRRSTATPTTHLRRRTPVTHLGVTLGVARSMTQDKRTKTSVYHYGVGMTLF